MSTKLCPECQERKISGTKDRCLFCADRNAKQDANYEFRKDVQPMDNCTHIIVVHKEADQEDLYRANGMLCASRQKDVVRFGTDISTAQNRPFLNPEMASKFLRVMAEVDLRAQEQMLPLHQVIDTYVTLEKDPKAVIDEQTIDAQHAGLVLPERLRLH